MLTIETERRLTKLFISLSIGELDCLHNRYNFISSKDFNGFQCFNRLDHQRKEYIDAYDIVDFFRSNNSYIAIDEAALIIMFYDKENKGNMSYSNFFIMLFSGIRYEDYQNKSNGLNGRISASTELLLMKLFIDELALVKEIKGLLKEVTDRYDFDVMDLYKAMEGRSCLTEHNLFMFMKRNGRELSKEEMSALFNRLNIEKSGGISLRELKRLFDSVQQIQSKDKETWRNCRDCNLASTLCIFNETHNISQEHSNNMTKLQKTIAGRLGNSMSLLVPMENDHKIIRTFTPEFPLKPKTLEESYRNELLLSKTKAQLEELNPSIYSDIYALLKQMIDSELVIERSKCELALRADFNVEDAFSIFGPKENSHITSKDLHYGLCSLDINSTSDDIKLLLFKYDLCHDGVLSYTHFFNMITPFEKDYRIMVESRIPSNYNPHYDKTDIFLNVTKQLLRSLLRVIIINERTIQSQRQQLIPVIRLYIEKIYQQIDCDHKGYITPQDLGGYLKDHKIILIQNQSDLLFIRLDRQRQGKVLKRDFINELMYSIN